MKTTLVTLIAICSQSASAFTAPNTPATLRSTSLRAANEKKENSVKNVALSGIAAALIASSSLITAPITADAFESGVYNYDSTLTEKTDFGSSELLSARSGGRMGGRSSVGARSSTRSSPASAGSRTSVNVYTPRPSPTVIVAPSVGYSPFGYSPFGGFGMGYGLGAVGGIGSEIREINQERQLSQERAELAATKEREAQLAERVRNLEQRQNQMVPSAPVNQ